MNNITKSDSKGVVGLLHKGEGLTISKPYERDIFLFSTRVAGTTFIKDIEELAKQLYIDGKLEFYREPNNPHDNKAIVIKDMDGNKVGYVPKGDNLIFSRLMDAGKLLFAKITKIEIIDYWVKIKIDIYLHE